MGRKAEQRRLYKSKSRNNKDAHYAHWLIYKQYVFQIAEQLLLMYKPEPQNCLKFNNGLNKSFVKTYLLSFAQAYSHLHDCISISPFWFSDLTPEDKANTYDHIAKHCKEIFLKNFGMIRLDRLQQ
jgi:hypothetical protein